MPAISLVVCIYKQRDLLERLLEESTDCYDDLVVVHDGPEDVDPARSVEQLVITKGGRFFRRGRLGSLEAQSPFAWGQAKHDWVLRPDADEFPSTDMKKWLRQFRNAPDPAAHVSGYTCVWPLWDGRRRITRRWPANRLFLFNRERVRFFGMVEQVPIADGELEPVPLILEHRPKRKSYGLGNLLLRRQAYQWRRLIAQSLLGKPTDLPCWRWTSGQWPQIWEDIRENPIRTALHRLLVWPLRSMRDFWRHERKLIPAAAVCGGIHHCLIALVYWRLQNRASLR